MHPPPSLAIRGLKKVCLSFGSLCFGTVLAVGGPEQVAALDAIQEAGQLGCFALTERLAGVQSGLAVD